MKSLNVALFLEYNGEHLQKDVKKMVAKTATSTKNMHHIGWECSPVFMHKECILITEYFCENKPKNRPYL